MTIFISKYLLLQYLQYEILETYITSWDKISSEIIIYNIRFLFEQLLRCTTQIIITKFRGIAFQYFFFPLMICDSLRRRKIGRCALAFTFQSTEMRVRTCFSYFCNFPSVYLALFLRKNASQLYGYFYLFSSWLLKESERNAISSCQIFQLFFDEWRLQWILGRKTDKSKYLS